MIILKRYGLPPIIGAAVYSILYAVSPQGRFLGWGLLLSLLFAYLVRVCDDIGDYKRDLSRGKAVLSLPLLTAMGGALLLSYIITAISTAGYLTLLPLALLLLQFAIPERYRDLIKPTFMPAAVITLAYEFFRLNVWVWIFVGILILSDLILIIFKQRREKE